MKSFRSVIIPVTPFEQNCTLLWCTKTLRAAVIDPGGDLAKVRRAIDETKVAVEKIWLTHGHIDHAGGATELKETRRHRRPAPRRQVPARHRGGQRPQIRHV
jgi:hydroxyacylglutathione hydrolase